MAAAKEIILVPLYRCPSPSCGKTHAVLPDFLPPLCRWFWEDILRIARRLSMGESAYSIAKTIHVSLAAMLNLKAWIRKAGPRILALTREAGLLDDTPPLPAPACAADTLTLVYRWPRWTAFTHCFSRALYPIRFPPFSSHVNLTG